MKTLSGVDGAFLHLETAQTPMHVGSLHLFELPPGYRGDFHAAVKRQIKSRLRLAPVLTRQLAPMPLQFANPAWVEAEAVDLDYHVQAVALPAAATQADLEACTAGLHAQLLERDRPLWRLYVFSGLANGQAAYYVKVHHALLDGQAGMQLAQVLFDLAPRPGRVARGARTPAEHPGRIALAAAALRHDAGLYIKLLRTVPELVRTLAGLWGEPAGRPKSKLGSNFAFGPRTPLNVPITAERGFAALSIPVDTLQAIASAHAATLNDVVLALCSGALRHYLARHGGVPRKPLIAAMPISLRKAGDTAYTTQATLSLVNLNTHVADPLRRLRAIRDAAAAMKGLARNAQGVIPTDFPTLGVPWLLQAVAALYGRSGITAAITPIANVVISNVAGPRVPLYAAGVRTGAARTPAGGPPGAACRMTTYWPLSIVEHGLGLNITVVSYAGAMGFGFTTARSAVPDACELPAALQAALAELLAATPPALAATPARARAGRTARPAASRSTPCAS